MPPSAWIRTAAADLALFAGIGVVMAILGPYGSILLPLPQRLAYWLACMIGGGVVGVALDTFVQRRITRFWPRLLLVSVGMTPGVSAVVGAVNAAMYGPALPIRPLAFMFQVFVVSFAAMALRQLVWAAPQRATESAAAPTGAAADPLGAFRQRLSARRRAAALIAVQAEDHYLRVHTDAGEDLIAARFSDALAELAAAPGFQTHRSWWVAADAIDSIRWSRGRGEAKLTCGLTVPISRSQAAQLKAAGWR